MKFLLTIALLLVLILAKAQVQPVIYEVFTYNDFRTGEQFCSCRASNLDIGTLWIYEANTNLEAPCWKHFGADYYTGWGTNYDVPYLMKSWPTSQSPQAFFRLRQIGTNFMFYTFYEP